MSLAFRVRRALDRYELSYDVIPHSPTQTSLDSAKTAHIPPGRLAKAVLLEDERGYVLALLPAACHLEFDALEDLTHRPLELATEAELDTLFPDCAHGAVPATGTAYGLDMVVDDSLLRMPDVYFEAGDHEELVHVERDAFAMLVGRSSRGRIAAPN